MREMLALVSLSCFRMPFHRVDVGAQLLAGLGLQRLQLSDRLPALDRKLLSAPTAWERVMLDEGVAEALEKAE